MARLPKGFIMARDLSFFEEMFKRKGYGRIAGIDEAGRGCLAGPVVAAAVILRGDNPVSGVNDSKELSPKQREGLFERIINEALSVSVGVVGALEIDRKNILNATIEAMLLAVKGLSPAPDLLLIDGPISLPLSLPQQGIIKGDKRSLSIASASIVAKVYRDRIMNGFATTYPGYGFERHKGYGTRDHLKALRERGPSEIHRRTFKGVSDFGEEKEISPPRGRAGLQILRGARI